MWFLIRIRTIIYFTSVQDLNPAKQDIFRNIFKKAVSVIAGFQWVFANEPYFSFYYFKTSDHSQHCCVARSDFWWLIISRVWRLAKPVSKHCFLFLFSVSVFIHKIPCQWRWAKKRNSLLEFHLTLLEEIILN